MYISKRGKTIQAAFPTCKGKGEERTGEGQKEVAKFVQEAVAGKSTGGTGKAAETEAGRPQNGLSLAQFTC